MKIEFDKYHGAGNDFILLDNRSNAYSNLTTRQLHHLCDRYFGIGADGVIRIDSHDQLDFEMVYFNSDGNLSSFCGNGGRCVVAFARRLGIIGSQTQFLAFDGLHAAQEINPGEIRIGMQAVCDLQSSKEFVLMDTGSPHYIQKVENCDLVDVKKEGSALRYSEPYAPDGINVNFVQKVSQNRFKIRTYERGVEDETLACGTGAVAAALAMYFTGETDQYSIEMEALGGLLNVEFKPKDKGFSDIYLQGSASHVYSGIIEL
ncbi:MAG: diaminopimelate epimerase [Flavobacteriaceae bacterium]